MSVVGMLLLASGTPDSGLQQSILHDIKSGSKKFCLLFWVLFFLSGLFLFTCGWFYTSVSLWVRKLSLGNNYTRRSMGSSLLGAGASVSLSGEREPLPGRARAQAQPRYGRAQPLAGR